jgi:opacity protein-like surface antigen
MTRNFGFSGLCTPSSGILPDRHTNPEPSVELMMRKFLLASTMLAFGVAGASAADLGAHSYVKAMAPVFSWSGFYVGANAGGGLQSTTIDDKESNLSSNSLAFSKGFATVGGTAGFNYQFGPGLVGIEGDINWSNFKDSLADPDWTRVRTQLIHQVRAAAKRIVER